MRALIAYGTERFVGDPGGAVEGGELAADMLALTTHGTGRLVRDLGGSERADEYVTDRQVGDPSGSIGREELELRQGRG